MSTFHIRSVPDDLYTRIQKLAQISNRSLSAQVITMLYEVLDQEERRCQQGRALSSIRRRRFAPPEGAPESLELLREDRLR